ncbi:MAG TPA: c-type cytochrome, partial [Rhodanobacteraceae bacterium]|nr:c-type cytochrome [Rhodanobacteraceae bacterium]
SAQLSTAKKPKPPQPALPTHSVAHASQTPVTPQQPSTTPAKTPMSASSSGPAAASTTAAPASSASSGAAAQFAQLEATPVKPGDATAGQAKAAACGACHGMDGNSTDAQYPKLAGENEQYIVTQLMKFKSGERQNSIMQGMAAPLSPQDMHDIGAYFAGKESLPGVSDQALAVPGGKLYREGDASRGIPACMACHGPDGHGNPGAIYPQLAGQHADYVQKTLQAWHDGTTWGNEQHAQIMPAIAQRLTKADIEAVASYVEGLHTAQPGEQVAGPEAAPTPNSETAHPAAAASAPAPNSSSVAPAPANGTPQPAGPASGTSSGKH